MDARTMFVIQFAKMLPAYLAQPLAIREAVNDLAGIVADPEATEDERQSAAFTIEEALFPGDAIDLETMQLIPFKK